MTCDCNCFCDDPKYRLSVITKHKKIRIKYAFKKYMPHKVDCERKNCSEHGNKYYRYRRIHRNHHIEIPDEYSCWCGFSEQLRDDYLRDTRDKELDTEYRRLTCR